MRWRDGWESAASTEHRCAACGMTFSTEHELTEHEKIHPKCNICGTAFPTESELIKHMQSHGTP